MPFAREKIEEIEQSLQNSRQNFVGSFALIDLFAIAYAPITHLTLEPVKKRTARAPEATIGIVTDFYGHYYQNRDYYLKGQPVASHWKPYYDFVKRHQKDTKYLKATQIRDALFDGVEAHILYDFPRTLSFLLTQYDTKTLRIAFDEATPVFSAARDQGLQTLWEAAQNCQVNVPTAWVMKKQSHFWDTLGAAQSMKSLQRMREQAWAVAIKGLGDSNKEYAAIK